MASAPDQMKQFPDTYGLRGALSGTSTGNAVGFGFAATFLRIANVGTTVEAYFNLSTGGATTDDAPLEISGVMEGNIPPCSGISLATASTSTTDALKLVNVSAVG